MATIILQAAGAFLGGAFGAVGSAIGSAAGALAGYTIDRALLESGKHYEGPRLSAARPFSAEEGAPIPRVYGTVRVGGTLIWATRFEEKRTTSRQGIKGGPKTTEYTYFANAAFALCEGEIADVRRIWADGREVDLTRVEIRVHRGTRDQLPDPLIEARQGEGNAPAYRGTAYVVIERFPIDDYGRRIPQFQFEVMRPVGALNGQIRSVAMIPGSTEYGLLPRPVKLTVRPGEDVTVNRHVSSAASDIEASLDELQALCPKLETVALVVTWFGDDLRAGHCRLRPMVTQSDPGGLSETWTVSGLARDEVPVVSMSEEGPAYGGTPSDASVIEAIRMIRARGLKVTLYPFVMMDVPAENTLPNPYGGDSQPAYPWRGRITCDPAPGMAGTADKTAAARGQVNALAGQAQVSHFATTEDGVRFTGDADDWGYRRFLLHYAKLAEAAGGVDGFLIGSELRGLTVLRDGENRFPFVEVLAELAGEVRGVLGQGTLITYGADWSEYFGHQPQDGSGDVFFHLDPLWAHEAVDAVGIDNYMPLSDWRDADYAGGNPDGFAGPYDPAGLRSMIASGDGYDWFYADAGDRAERRRTPITDGAHGKHWVYRYKDIASWWSNPHFDRIGGVEAENPTAWVPKSKPVIFTELGCAAVDKGPNQPNVFPDPKSSENAAPYFSSGGMSDLAQRRFLAAHYDYWSSADTGNPVSNLYGGRMVDPAAICVWAWDARPFPAFPLYGDVWSDGRNWSRGHWLNGRLSGVAVDDLINAMLADFGLPAADTGGADGSLAGYIVADPGTARAALEPICDLYGLAAGENAGRLVFSTEARADAVVKPAALVIEDDAPVIEWVRDPDSVLPTEAHLDFRDLMKNHQAATAEVYKAGAATDAKTFISFPGVMAPGAAQGLLADWLRRKWDGRERVTFSVPMTEMAIRPGAVVRLAEADDEYLVTEVEDGLKRTVHARRIRRLPPTPWEPDEQGKGTGIAIGASRPLALFLDLPMTPGAETPHQQFRLAVRAKPWRSQVVLVSPEETGFEQRMTATRRAIVGKLLEDLGGGFEGRIDRASSVRVELFDGDLASVTALQMLNGANAAAIRSSSGAWEIIQFAEAAEVAASVWRLSGLLRGQLGTNDATAAGATAGADFVLLDEAVQPAGLLASEAGLRLNWRVGPAGFDISDEHFAMQAETGGVRSRLPLSPVHIGGRLDAAGDLAISWIRRGRIDADSWLAEEIPLGEETEAYRIAVLSEERGTVRMATVSAPSWTYTQQQMAADFGAIPESITVTVSQLGALGEGVPATATVPIR